MNCKHCGKPKGEHTGDGYGGWLCCNDRWESMDDPEPSAEEHTRCPMCDAPRVENVTAYECGSWHTDQPESFVDHCSEPSAPEPTATECLCGSCMHLNRTYSSEVCKECMRTESVDGIPYNYETLNDEPEPSAPEPKRCCETCRWVATKFNCEPCITCIDYSKWKAPEQNAPEQSGVEWLEVDAIKDDEGIYACLFQLQQVCTEQAKAYIRLRRVHNDLAIKHHDLEQVVTKQAERIAALEKRLEGGSDG